MCREKQGFTLLEVLVAFTIVSLALTWFLYFLSEVQEIRHRAREELKLFDQAELVLKRKILSDPGFLLPKTENIETKNLIIEVANRPFFEEEKENTFHEVEVDFRLREHEHQRLRYKFLWMERTISRPIASPKSQDGQQKIPKRNESPVERSSKEFPFHFLLPQSPASSH